MDDAVPLKEHFAALREADQRAVVIALEAQKSMMKALAWAFSAALGLITTAFVIAGYFATR